MLHKTRLYIVDFHVNGRPYKIPVQTQTILFCMVQEAISNTIKHAKANRVVIQVDYDPVWFSLSIRDNGIGISQDAMTNKKEVLALPTCETDQPLLEPPLKYCR